MANGRIVPNEGETEEDFLMRASAVIPPNEGEDEDSYLARVAQTEPEPVDPSTADLARKAPIAGFLMPNVAASRLKGEGIGQTLSAGADDLINAFNLPTRAVAGLMGEDAYDPDAYAQKPAFERKTKEFEASPDAQYAPLDGEGREDYVNRMQELSPEKTEFEILKDLKNPPSEFLYKMASDPTMLSALSPVIGGARRGMSNLFSFLSGGKRPAKALDAVSKAGGKSSLVGAAETRAGRINQAADEARIAADEATAVKEGADIKRDVIKDTYQAEKDAARDEYLQQMGLTKEKAQTQIDEAARRKTLSETGAERSALEADKAVTESSQKYYEKAKQLKDPKSRKELFPENEVIDAAVKNMDPVDVSPVVGSLKSSIKQLEGVLDPKSEGVKKQLQYFINKVKGLSKNATPQEQAKFFKTKYTAKEALDLRREIDGLVKNWDPSGKDLLDTHLKPVRKLLKDGLIKSSGGTKYAPTMKKWSDKLQAEGDLFDILTTTNNPAQAKSIARVVGNISKKGPGSPQEVEIMNKVNDLFGFDFLPAPMAAAEKARTAKELARLAKENATQVSKTARAGVSQADKAQRAKLVAGQRGSRQKALTEGRKNKENVFRAKEKSKQASQAAGAVSEGPLNESEAFAEALNLGPKAPRISRTTGKPIPEFVKGGGREPSASISYLSSILDVPTVRALGGLERISGAVMKYGIPPAALAKMPPHMVKSIVSQAVQEENN